MSDVFVVNVNVNFCTKEHRTEFLECFNNGKHFFFDCSVILLCFVKFASVECKRETVLFCDCP